MGLEFSLYSSHVPHDMSIPNVHNILPHVRKLKSRLRFDKDDIDLEDQLQSWHVSGAELDNDVEEIKVNLKLEPYERYRTRIGSPSINRHSFTDEEIYKFKCENDGFPLPSTEHEKWAFDKEVFVEQKTNLCMAGHNKKKLQRSKSATTVPNPDMAKLKLKPRTQKDEDYKSKVMESGYVKTIVDKINLNSFQVSNENSEDEDLATGNGGSNEHIGYVHNLLTKLNVKQVDPGCNEWQKKYGIKNESTKSPMLSVSCANKASGAGSFSNGSPVSTLGISRTSSVASSSSNNSPNSSCANSICDSDSHVSRSFVPFNQECFKHIPKSCFSTTLLSSYSFISSPTKSSPKLHPAKLCDEAETDNAYDNANGAITSACAKNRNSMSCDFQDTSEQFASQTGTSEKQDCVSQSFEFSVMSLNPAELFDQHWSKTELSFDVFDCEVENLMISKQKDEDEQPKDRLHLIALELLSTERTYVDILHLLDQVFHTCVVEENKNGSLLPPDVISQMFANIKPIYSFHHDFLLPALEERMKNWLKEKKIGDIMAKLAPFLKLYTEYVKNYGNTMSLLDKWTSQAPKFAVLLQEIQKKPECKQLSLQHHMLGPIQRIPRYELLLKDYLKRLEPDAQDRPDAQKALDLVTEAACHSNTAMNKLDKFNKLLSIIPRLNGEGTHDLISPTREFIKEGPITKISARGGEKQGRYLFLFNDLLLVCSEQITGSYKIRARLNVDGMRILEGENKIVCNTFCVQCMERTIEFLDEANNGTGLDWYATFQNVITDFQKRHVGRVHAPESIDDNSDTSLLGLCAPKWVQDVEVTMCMGCQDKFTAIKRRHHCRACGKVFCGACSSQKAYLRYDNKRLNRVCQKCFKVITSSEITSLDNGGPISPRKLAANQVFADEASVLANYLNVMDKGKSWTRRWITVRDDFAMYFYKKNKDPKALHTLPLPGHEIKIIGNFQEHHNVFSLTHKDAFLCYFQTDTEAQLNHWVHTIEKLIKLELPSEDNKRLSSHSTESSQSSTSSGQSVQS